MHPSVRRPVVALVASVYLLVSAACSTTDEPMEPESGSITTVAVDPQLVRSFSEPDLRLTDVDDRFRILTLPEGVDTMSRPEFSPDGDSLYFVDQDFAAWEYVFDAGDGRPGARRLTDPSGVEVLRIAPMTNDDALLCARSTSGGRFDGTIQVLQAPLGSSPPVDLREACWEGIAASRSSGSTEVLWTQSNLDFENPGGANPEDITSQIFTARVDYDDGTPSLADLTVVLDRADVTCPAPALEAQGFRSSDGSDDEIIFTAYGLNAFEVLGVDRASGSVTNYSRSPQADEVEGVAPSGEWTTVERNPDLWRLSLDGEARWQPLVDAGADFPGYRVSNSVISPDETTMAFSLATLEQDAGDGTAVVLLGLGATRSSRGAPEPDRLDSALAAPC